MNEQQHSEQNDACLDRGLLVTMRDGELSLNENVQAMAHLLECADCSANERDVQHSGQEIYTLFDALSPAPNEIPNAAKAFAALQAKISVERRTTGLHMVTLAHRKAPRPAVKRPRVRWAMIAVAAAVIAALLLPNAGVLASQFLALFRVQHFEPVRLDAGQVTQNLYKNLNNFGDVKYNTADTKLINNPTKAQVEQYIHFPLLLPQMLPQGVSNTPQYNIFVGTRATFTFNTAKAQATMQQMGDGNLGIPSQLSGAAYTITVAPGVAIQYALTCNGDTSTACRNRKQLGVIEVPSPTVQGTTANALNDLRAYMLLLPHLSTDIHNLWQSVDMSTGTIPLPLPTAQTNAEQVSVQGVSGVLLVDSSIKYGGVIWQKNNVVYVIITNTSERTQILATANSLR